MPPGGAVVFHPVVLCSTRKSFRILSTASRSKARWFATRGGSANAVAAAEAVLPLLRGLAGVDQRPRLDHLHEVVELVGPQGPPLPPGLRLGRRASHAPAGRSAGSP